MVREYLPEKMTPEQYPEGMKGTGQAAIWGKSVPGSRSSKCKDPVVENVPSMLCLGIK